MKTIVALLACLIASASYAGDFDLEVGLAVHPISIDKPGFILTNPLGIVEASYKIDDRWRVVLSHMSGIRDDDYGYGVNTLQIRLKLK